MTIYDPNGSLHEYRLRRARQESYRNTLIFIGIVCVLVAIVAAVTLAISMTGNQ